MYNEKIFISISLYDRGGALAGGRWGDRLLDLIHILGPDNIFLSIYENDGDDAAAAALRRLEERVPCRSKVVFEGAPSLDAFPTVTMPDGTQRVKRIAYLAEVRNRALEALPSASSAGGGDDLFDKVLFLNDALFDPLDAAHLLFSTNADPASGRARYLTACALDFFHPLRNYDVYALRDADGNYPGSTMFPFFTGAGRGISRRDVLAQRDAVRVASCWGGMVAARAAFLQRDARVPDINGSLAGPGSAADLPGAGATGHVVVDRTATPPPPGEDLAVEGTPVVRFRHEPGLFYDASECCLFHADMRDASSSSSRSAGAARQLGETGGVYVNPYVRVAYRWDVFSRLRVARLWERLLVVPGALVNWWDAEPRPNPYRGVRAGAGRYFEEEVWAEGGWRLERREGRPGMFCGVRDMQVVSLERRDEGGGNYMNTRVPPGQKLEFPMMWGELLPEDWKEEYAACSDAQKKAYWDSPWWKPAVKCRR